MGVDTSPSFVFFRIMKVIVDAFGGDNAPLEVVYGALDALSKKKSLHIILTGDKVQLEEILKDKSYDQARLSIVDAPEVIGNDEVPSNAVRTKKNSSLVKGLEILASDDDALAFVSAGATGAVLVGAYMKLGRIKGISRPALAPSLPTVKGNPVILCDCGANIDCKPLNILHFAIMGSAFSTAIAGVVKPTVGLLSNGAEAEKGNDLNKEAYKLLSSCSYIEFKGNCEARDLLSGDFDVVVADGFNGNIALKSAEGTAGAIFSILIDSIKNGGVGAKIGALLLKPALKKVKNKMDYNSQGGACFLGLNKVVIKAHGSSKRKSISASILQARKLAKAGAVDKINAYVDAVAAKEEDLGENE